MTHLLARLLLCLVAMLAFPALAQNAPNHGDPTSASAPRSEEIVARINAAVAQGGTSEEISQRIHATLAGTGYQLMDAGGNINASSGSERILSYDCLLYTSRCV